MVQRAQCLCTRSSSCAPKKQGVACPPPVDRQGWSLCAANRHSEQRGAQPCVCEAVHAANLSPAVIPGCTAPGPSTAQGSPAHVGHSSSIKIHA